MISWRRVHVTAKYGDDLWRQFRSSLELARVDEDDDDDDDNADVDDDDAIQTYSFYRAAWNADAV